MTATRCFFDTNIFVYLISADPVKAEKAEAILANGGVVSIQVLNEFASVASRKQRLSLPEIREVLGTIRRLCDVESLSLQTHDCAMDLVDRYGFSIYDALIVAAAQLAGCATLYTEDLQHGQRIGELTICDPFRIV